MRAMSSNITKVKPTPRPRAFELLSQRGCHSGSRQRPLWREILIYVHAPWSLSVASLPLRSTLESLSVAALGAVSHKMPAATLPPRKRRSGELDDEDDDSTADAATPFSQRNKRSRLDLNVDASPSSQSPLLPDGYLSQPHDASPSKRLPLRNSTIKHQPGSIVRVKLTNFVTYTAVEFYPGPSLNMVIGPNGTGKSTLVCAICLGLGWGAQVRCARWLIRGLHEANKATASW